MASSLLSIDVSPLPLKSFTFINILDYTNVLNDTHGCNNNYNFEIRKGRLLFETRFVTNLRFKDASTHWMIGSTVKAEMKKKEKYEVVLQLQKDGKVIDGECACPGGLRPGCCKHIFGVLAALEDYSRLELFKAPTERLQQWHQPKPVLVTATPVKDMFPDEDGELTSTLFPDTEALKSAPQRLPIFTVLNGSKHNVLFRDELFYSSTTPLPLETTFSLVSETPDLLNIDHVLYYHEHVRIPLSAAQKLERETLCQGNSLWHTARSKRLTASTIHQVLQRQQDFEKLAVDLLERKDISHIPAVSYGRRMESAMKNYLVEKYPNFIFRNTGCIVSPSHPYIAASPDGLLFNSCEMMIVEIKCIFNVKGACLKELASARKDFCLELKDENILQLKKNHKYYHQIQCQLFCSGIKKCAFIIYYGNPKVIYSEVIDFDQAHMASCLIKLRNFYFSFLIKEIIRRNM